MGNSMINDIKKMNISELEALASDIRKQIIESVSTRGGHLSSNLGIVELSIALHYVFDSPNDLLIYDVSHQTYAHKIITGRSLDNLRQLNGVSGFARIGESVHDVYESGHSSTSISALAGFLEAKKNNENIHNVVSIIGDSSITNGLSFEALNYLGALKDQKAIIILNDNQMSISKSVGSLAMSFNKIRARGNFKLLRKITPKGIKKMLKSFAYRQNLFEYLGFRYFEGIDGHNFKELIKYLSFARDTNRSVVLHVKTQKGKGFVFSEEDNTGYWHHVDAFDKVTGLLKNPSLYNNFGEEISEYLSSKIKEGDNSIRIITPAMTLGSGLSTFATIHKDNFIDVGIAEENAVTMSSSMAIGKLKPFVFMYSTFSQRAYDQILHDVARPNLPVIICLDRAGIISGDGDTHQGIFDVAFLSTMPNITILAPKNAQEAKYAVDFSLEKNGPVVIRYAKYDRVNYLKADCDFNRWDIIQDGDVAIVSYGDLLSSIYPIVKDTNIALINAKNLSVIDTDVLNKYQKIVVIEEVIQTSSLGEKIISYVYHNHLSNQVMTHNLGMNYLETGSKEELINKYLGKLDEIIRKETKC